MFIVSSEDGGKNWQLEKRLQLGTDVREPHFLLLPDGTFVFSFFEAGTDPLAFEPKGPQRMFYYGRGNWSDPEPWGKLNEVIWQIGSYNGTGYASSYEGSHYDFLARPDVALYFNKTEDGKTWTPMNSTVGQVYRGGASEVGWTFDLDGTFWGVLRNEDGDDSGWGSRIARAKAGDIGNWELFPKRGKSDPNIYESPRMFRHGNEVFLVARRDNEGVYWNHDMDSLPWEL